MTIQILQKALSNIKPVRWLHVSDFHVGKNPDFEGKFLGETLKNIQENINNGIIPDFVFITGDVANKGKQVEYQKFFSVFFNPLIDMLYQVAGTDILERVFIIPGNHDVNLANSDPVTMSTRFNIAPYLTATETGLSVRKIHLINNFKDYIDSEMNGLTVMGADWLVSLEGSISKVVSLRNLKIGILAMNTAWLCGGQENEEGMLTPGEDILEKGLSSSDFGNCDVRIVIGHHPIDWFIKGERKKIRTLLARNKVFYLHGHEHTNGIDEEAAAGSRFWRIQAGSIYPENEDKLWANSLLWCELYVNEKMIVEPLRWSKDFQEWKVDMEAFPNIYWDNTISKAVVPLETPAGVQQRSIYNDNSLILPDGWDKVDEAFIMRKRSELNAKGGLSDKEVISFFNGRSPTWEDALFSREIIPARGIVGLLKTQIEQDWATKSADVRLLWGPGGEGKTTALYQVVCDLVESKQDWQILWHSQLTKPLPPKFLERLSFNKKWLIVSDEAHHIVKDILAVLRGIKEGAYPEILLLLCSRTIDWYPIDKKELFKEFEVKKTDLSDLNKLDADAIVRAWHRYGDEGMGHLKNQDIEAAAEKFYLAAQEQKHPTRYGEGAFLGALLEVRIGDEMKIYVQRILSSISKQAVNQEETLADIFSKIAVFHKINIPLIDKEVLSALCGRSIGNVNEMILKPLKGEAAIAIYGDKIFVRHTNIANAAMDIFARAPFYLNEEDILFDITTKMIKYKNNQGEGGYPASEWEYLSSAIFESEVENPDDQIRCRELGLNLAERLVKWQSIEARYLVKWSELLRKSKKADIAKELCRSRYELVYPHRPFYYEWGTAEGQYGNLCIGVWLAGVSVADDFTPRLSLDKLSRDRVRITFSGLAAGLRELFNSRSDNWLFVQATASVAQLGLTIKANKNVMEKRAPDKFFIQDRDRAATEGALIRDMNVLTNRRDAFEDFKAAIALASELREEELYSYISSNINPVGCFPPAGEQLTFSRLASILGIDK